MLSPPLATAQLSTPRRGRHRVDLAGELAHPHWLPFLCSGLAARGISVVEGRAHREGHTSWTGHFELDSSRAQMPLESLDLIALAGQRPATRDTAAVELSTYVVVRRPDHALEVRLQAPDALGLLGRLLSRVALLTLLPTALDIRTVGGTVEDIIVLGGIGGGAPTAEVATALQELLSGMVPVARV